MTVRMLQYWNGYSPDAIVTGLSNESALIAAGYATADLDGANDGRIDDAKLRTNAAGSVSLVGQNIDMRPSGRGSHVRVAVLGDSISSRTFTAFYTSPSINASAISPWHWLNWGLGAPFVFAQNLAVSGDTAKGIASRVQSVRSSIKAVCLLAGSNDVVSMSSSANQATIDSTYTTVSGYIGDAVANLVAAGKIVCIATIPPNNAISTDTDSRIQLLDRLNAYISALANGTTVFVADMFTAIWDAAQPTIRVAKTNALNADNLHPTNYGAQLMGAAGETAGRSVYFKCLPDVDIYEGFQPMRPLYSEFRRSTVGTAGTISAGSGTIGDGWRCAQNAGTATFTVDATEAYTPSASFIGSWADVPDPIECYWQKFSITAAANNDNPRLRLPANTDIQSSGNAIDGVFGGSEMFLEIECYIESATNLQQVSLGTDVYFTAGTSPADQPAWGSTYARVSAGTATDSSSSGKAIGAGRYVLRTPVLRVPENINGTVTLQALPFADMIFNGAGSAVVKFARPRLWHKMAGRIG